MDDIKTSSNRSFGIVFFVVFLLIALYPIINGHNVKVWSLAISFIFLILGLAKSQILTPFNKLWFKFGIILGKVISPLIMGIIFFLVITPINILMKIFQKDIIGLKKKGDSYWKNRNEKIKNMRNQF